MTTRILTLSGESRKVFKFLRLLAAMKGEKTLGELEEPDELEHERQADALRDWQMIW